MSAPYTVTLFDQAGERSATRHDTFAEALKVYRGNLGKGVVPIMSADGCEHDGERWHDGLTEEEREQL